MTPAQVDHVPTAERAALARKVKIELVTRHHLTKAGAGYVFGYARWRLDLRPNPPNPQGWPPAQTERLEGWVNIELGLPPVVERPTTTPHPFTTAATGGDFCQHPRCARQRAHPIHRPSGARPVAAVPARGV